MGSRTQFNVLYRTEISSVQGYEAWIVQPYTAPTTSKLFPFLTLYDKIQDFLTVTTDDR